MKSVVVVLIIVVASVSFAFARSANSKSITFTEAVIVGGVAIPPGEYKVEWSGKEPNVVVTFSRANEIFATVPATLQLVRNPYNGAFRLAPQPSGGTSLVGIDWSNLTLSFGLQTDLARNTSATK